jgi:hypothetical protein
MFLAAAYRPKSWSDLPAVRMGRGRDSRFGVHKLVGGLSERHPLMLSDDPESLDFRRLYTSGTVEFRACAGPHGAGSLLPGGQENNPCAVLKLRRERAAGEGDRQSLVTRHLTKGALLG